MISREEAIKIARNDPLIDFDSFSESEQEDIISGVIRSEQINKQSKQEKSSEVTSFHGFIFIVGIVVSIWLGVYLGELIETLELGVVFSLWGNTVFNIMVTAFAVLVIVLSSRAKSETVAGIVFIKVPIFAFVFAVTFEPVKVPSDWKFKASQLLEQSEVYKAKINHKTERQVYQDISSKLQFSAWYSQYDSENDVVLVTIEVFNDSAYLIDSVEGTFSIEKAYWPFNLIGPSIEPYTVGTLKFYLPSVNMLEKHLTERETDSSQRLTYLVLSNMFTQLKNAYQSTAAGFQISHFEFKEYDRDAAFQKEALEWLELN